MEPLRNCEVKFKRDYDDYRIFYELDTPIDKDDNIYYYYLNMVEIEKIANVKGMSQLETIDYIMEHDVSCYIEDLEYQDVFKDMCEEMKKVFYKDEKRLEVHQLDEAYRLNCLEIIDNYMNELYKEKDRSFIDDLNDDQLYRYRYYIEKGYTLSKIHSLIKKPDLSGF